MGNGGRAGQQRRSRVADLLTNISPAAVTTEPEQEVTRGISETTAPLQTDNSDNGIPWNDLCRVYQLAQNTSKGQLYKLGPVNDYLLMK